MREEAHAAELAGAGMEGTDLAGTFVLVAEFTTTRAQRPGLSTETGKRLEDMLHPAVRAASGPAPSAATTMADRPGAFLHAEAPVWGRGPEEEEALVAAAVVEAGMVVVDVTSPGFGRPGFSSPGLGMVPGGL